MKYLVIATPIVPLTDQAILDEVDSWMGEQRDAGRITAAFGLVGGGGCSVMNASSHEELHQQTALSPIGAYLSFDIWPLIDLETTFAMGRARLTVLRMRLTPVIVLALGVNGPPRIPARSS
jgi:hypothetical protein